MSATREVVHQVVGESMVRCYLTAEPSFPFRLFVLSQHEISRNIKAYEPLSVGGCFVASEVEPAEVEALSRMYDLTQSLPFATHPRMVWF